MSYITMPCLIISSISILLATVFKTTKSTSFLFKALHMSPCRALNRNDVDLVVLNTVANNMLIEDIIRHGVVIYDHDIDAREDYEVTSLHQAIDFKTQRLAVMGV